MDVDLERAQPRRPWRDGCNFFRVLALLLVVCLELCRVTLAYFNKRLGGLILDCLLNLVVYPIIQVHEWRVEDGFLDVQSGIVHGTSNWWMKIVRIFSRRPETTFGIPTPRSQRVEVQLQDNLAAAFRSATTHAATREETGEETELAASSSHIHAAPTPSARRVWSHSAEQTWNSLWRETSFCMQNEALVDSSTRLDLRRNTVSQTLPIHSHGFHLQGPADHENGNQEPTYHPTPVTQDCEMVASSPTQGTGSNSAIVIASASNVQSVPNVKEAISEAALPIPRRVF